MVSAPDWGPPALGVNVTFKVHPAPGARLAPQLSVSANWELTSMPARLRTELPLFRRVTTWTGPEAPTTWLPKLKLEGDNLARGPGWLMVVGRSEAKMVAPKFPPL